MTRLKTDPKVLSKERESALYDFFSSYEANRHARIVAWQSLKSIGRSSYLLAILSNIELSYYPSEVVFGCKFHII